MVRSLYVKQKGDSMGSEYVWRYSRHTNVMSRPNHSLALVSSQQPAASSHGEIRARSSSSDSRVRADKGNDTLGSGYDTNHLKDTNRQAAKEAESVKKITDVTNNQITHLLKCEEHELVNISTGHKAESTHLARANEESCCSKRNRQ